MIHENLQKLQTGASLLSNGLYALPPHGGEASLSDVSEPTAQENRLQHHLGWNVITSMENQITSESEGHRDLAYRLQIPREFLDEIERVARLTTQSLGPKTVTKLVENTKDMLHEIFGILIECAAQKAAHFRLAADALIEPGRSTLNDQLSSDSDEEGAIQAPSSDDDERGSSRGGRQRTRAAHQTILTSEHGFEGGAPINRLRSCHGWLCAAHGATPRPPSLPRCATCATRSTRRTWRSTSWCRC